MVAIIIKSEVAYKQYCARKITDQLTRKAFNIKLNSLYSDFSSANHDDFENVVNQRVHIYAHTTGVLVPGIPDEKLKRTVLSVQEFLNRISGLLFGSKFLYSSISSWSISTTLSSLKYAHEVHGAAHLNMLRPTEPGDSISSRTFGIDNEYYSLCKARLEELQTLFCPNSINNP